MEALGAAPGGSGEGAARKDTFLSLARAFLSSISYGSTDHHQQCLPPPPHPLTVHSSAILSSLSGGGRCALEALVVSPEEWFNSVVVQGDQVAVAIQLAVACPTGRRGLHRRRQAHRETWRECSPVATISILGYLSAADRLRASRAAQASHDLGYAYVEAPSLLGGTSTNNHPALGRAKGLQKVQSYRHMLPCAGLEPSGRARGSSSTGTASHQSAGGQQAVGSESPHSHSHGYVELYEGANYNADYLDDPQLRTGKHRTVIVLSSFLGSINHYTKADFLKRELNEKFRKLHPAVHPTITLSQIRNLKSRILQIGVQQSFALVTIARAYTFIEKLILRAFITKLNRRLVAACCLVLAAKATDSREIDYKRLFDRLASELSISRKEAVDAEFAVLAALSFRLQVGEDHFGGHLNRILTALDYSNLQEYLGERMYHNWQRISQQ